VRKIRIARYKRILREKVIKVRYKLRIKRERKKQNSEEKKVRIARYKPLRKEVRIVRCRLNFVRTVRCKLEFITCKCEIKSGNYLFKMLSRGGNKLP